MNTARCHGAAIAQPGTHARAPRLAAMRGAMTLPVAAAVLALSLMLLGAWTAAGTAQIESVQARQRLKLLAQAQIALGGWYRDHLDQLDGPAAGPPPDPAEAVANLGLVPPLALGLSDPLPDTSGQISGTPGQVPASAGQDLPGGHSRLLLAWIAPNPRPGRDVFDRQSGRLLAASLDTQMIEVDGHVIERAARREAELRLQRISSALEVWFQGRVQDDPLHRLDRNYFRPADPDCRNGALELPCLPTYQAADRLDFWTTALGLSAGDLQGPWGPDYPLEVSNGEDASLSPPFSVALRFRVPGGMPVAMRAVEPGP